MDNTVEFNSNDFNDVTGFTVTDFDFNLYPNRQLQTFKLANQNRSALTSAEYVEKIITVYGIIKDCTREDAEVTLANLRAITQAVRGDLVVTQYDRDVSYIATLQIMEQRWVGNNMFVTMTFYCDIPTGIDATVEDLILLANTNTTTQPHDYAITLAGSSIEQYPIITIALNTLTAGGGDTITIGNSSNGHEMQITRTWAASDDIIIDTFEKTVTVNNLDVEYTGRIPEFNVGSTNIVYGDDFSARNVDTTAEYQRRYV
jgi:phage-related protein